MPGKANPAKMGSAKARNTAARLVAVQSVYDMAITGHDASEVLAGYRDHRWGQKEEGIQFVPADLDLLAKIVRGVEDKRPELLEMVQGALDQRQGLSQPEALLRALLLCGAYEMLAHNDIDAALIIAEYKSVADGFFEGGEPKLVHAVLDRLNKALRA
ncbi:MAG TPA: transcription antitermination protein NusB [Alphaproteobacteria bacterium]